jgi:hypothetical protein
MELKPGDVKITNISMGARIGSDQKPERFYNVTFIVFDKITDGVEIPRDQYTAERGRAAVMAKAQEHADLWTWGQ